MFGFISDLAVFGLNICWKDMDLKKTDFLQHLLNPCFYVEVCCMSKMVICSLIFCLLISRISARFINTTRAWVSIETTLCEADSSSSVNTSWDSIRTASSVRLSLPACTAVPSSLNAYIAVKLFDGEAGRRRRDHKV